jgi:hypothetical protein
VKLNEVTLSWPHLVVESGNRSMGLQTRSKAERSGLDGNPIIHSSP